MNSKADFVHGGGWVIRETFGRPKARFFIYLSVAWFIVSIFAGTLVWSNSVELSPFYRWSCVFLFSLEIPFIVLATVFRLIEKPRTLVENRPNPDHDARNLY